MHSRPWAKSISAMTMTIGAHAVVVGGSIGGLLAARVLSDTYKRVTVLDRDALPTGLEDRRAVPQGHHVHGFLPQAQAHVEELFPGLGAEMEAAGAPTYRALEQLRWIINGRELARASTGMRAILASRPFIEGHLRRRVRELPTVDLVEHCEVLELLGTGGRVRGVHTAGGVLRADLVVCATGRSAQVPAWLTALGFRAPPEERIPLGLVYASRRLRLRPGALGDDTIVLVAARPDRPRALAMFAQEDGSWLLSISGYGPEHRPPRDDEGFLAFMASVAPPEVAQAIRDAEPVTAIATHAFPVGRRRRYDRMGSFPNGLLPFGDAICSINPLYAQGIALAAAEAIALRRCLRSGDRRLARRFFVATRAPLDDAWRLARRADLALPVVRARRPPHVRAVNRYLRRMHAVAEHDPVAAAAFVRVVGMLERPSSLFRPSLALRVLRGSIPEFDHQVALAEQ